MITLGERWLIPVLLLVAILGSINTLIKIIALPGDLSANRLVLLSIPVVFGMGLLSILFFVIRIPSRYQNIISQIKSNDRILTRINIILPMIWLAMLFIAFLSITSLGRWGAVYVRLSPILQLAFLFVTEIWIFWLFQTRISASFSMEKAKGPLLAGLFLIFGIALVWLIIALTGRGIGIGTQYWGKSGVPILHWQIGISWVIMLIWIGFDRHNKIQRQTWKKDVVIFFALWITAFLIWQSIPITPTRYTVAAYPPNYANYPYSDAGDYALEAEAIRIGNGFPFGFIDKPLHLTFLTALSWLAGSDYSRMIQIQTGFLALIPALIYLIASKIHSRPAGILAGLVILFMQVNNLSIAGSIQATNVKMAMSKSLTAMMLMIFSSGIIGLVEESG